MSPYRSQSSLQRGVAVSSRDDATPPPRVLVADDHEDTRLMLKVFLGGRGFDVIEAADGEEALALSKRARPDIILIDSSLPRIDGVAVTQHLRHDSGARRIPIVFFSGCAEPVAQRAAFDAGCDEYLTKPISLDHLAAILIRHLDKHRRTGYSNKAEVSV